MKYLHTDSGQVMALDAIRAAHPNMAIPDGADLADLGYCLLQEAEPPEVPPGSRLLEAEPVLVDGRWCLGWVVAPLDPQEIAAEVQATINRLEQQQILPRPVRDFMLAAMLDKAKELGLTEEQLVTKNTLYRRVKQFDEQIAALREHL